MSLRSVLNLVYQFEISQILWLQEVFQPWEYVMELLSVCSQPRVIYLYLLPIFMAFSTKFYCKIMIAAISSNFLTNILKWIIGEARPYWWVHETDSYSTLTRPALRQTEITCETSAGQPSGHVMFQAAFLYVVITEIVRTLDRKDFNYKIHVKILAWIFYVCILLCVGLSRMYFGCHFLHQCMFGASLGQLQTSYIIDSPTRLNKFFNASKKRWFLIGTLMVLAVLGLYFTQKLLGIDPQWTIKIAFKWCKNPLFISPETTPIFSLIKDFGLLFGFVLSAPLSPRFKTELDLKRSFPLTTFLIFGYSRLIKHVPRQNGVWAFYGCTFLVHLFFVLILLNLMPKFCKKKQRISQ